MASVYAAALPAGGSRYPASESTLHDGKHYIHMDGKAVYRFATRVMAQATNEALEAAGLTTADVRWIMRENLKKKRIVALDISSPE